MGKHKKNKWKNLGVYAAFIVFCGGIGVLIGKTGIADGWKGMPLSDFLIKLVVLYLFFMLTVLLHIIVHEAGHMIAALLRGWKFLSFMILGVVLSRQEGRFRLSRFRLAGASGQCLMQPPQQGDTDWGITFYNLGGVLANLLLTLVSVIPLLTDYESLSWAAASFLTTLVVTGVFIILMNGVPHCLAGIPNDGMNILKLRKDAFSSQVFLDAMRVMGYLMQDEEKQLNSMPYLCDGKELDPMNAMHVMAVSTDLSLAMSRMDFEKAREILKRIEPYEKKIVPLYRYEMTFDRIFLTCTLSHEKEAMADLLDESFLRYLKQQSTFRPSALRVQYLLARLYEKDEIKSDRFYWQFQKVCRTYYVRGEVTIEKRLVEYIRQLPVE